MGFKNLGYRFPSSVSKDPAEARLGQRLSSYVSKSSECFDLAFTAILRELNFKYRAEVLNGHKDEINKFYAEHGYIMSGSSKNPKERKLHSYFKTLTYKTSPCLDREFAKKYEGAVSWLQYRVIEKAKKILNFYKSTGTPPLITSKNKEERLWAGFVNDVKYSPKGISFLPENLKQDLLSMKNPENRSLPIGVYLRNRPGQRLQFQARLQINNKYVYLGTFSTVEKAQTVIEDIEHNGIL